MVVYNKRCLVAVFDVVNIFAYFGPDKSFQICRRNEVLEGSM